MLKVNACVPFTSTHTNGDSLDWKGITATEITERVLPRVKSGSIVLFHNAAEHTPEALPDIIETLQSQGYTFVKIADLILDGEYTIDANGMQCPAQTEGSGASQ